MNQRVNQEWTSSEVEEARTLIARLNRNDCNYDGDSHDKNNNKKHDIMDELHARFPWKTRHQVTDLYIGIVVEIHMLHSQEEKSGGVSGTHDVSHTVDDLVNKRFGVPEEEEEEEAALESKDFVFGCPLENMAVMVMEEEAPVVEENKMADHQPVVVPHARRFWTKEEHRLFLRGLQTYGRGQWKNISKYFVTTRTPIQVSSHAQKYFKRLERRGLGGQRYSINDVGLHDVDPWKAENSSSAWQALAFANHRGPTFSLQAPASPFFPNLAQFWSPFLK